MDTLSPPSSALIVFEADPVSLAFRDSLTQASNRHSFDLNLQWLLTEIKEGSLSSAALIFLDLDRFKQVNDTLGHAVGDALLRMVVERMRSVLPPESTLARLGGDEFAILLETATESDAVELATKVLELVRRVYLIEGQVIHIGVSAGIALTPLHAADRELLLRFADLALYRSKANGRGICTVFRPEMAEEAQRRRELELELRRALMLRQFVLRYQPQVDIETDDILALEALLFWKHPLRGLLPAGEFLPVAEELNIAMPIAEWMLRSACREAVRWPGEMRVSLNVAALHFEAGRLGTTVEQALNAAGLAGSRLEIEVTEDILLRDGPNVLATLEHLRSLGVYVAIDSFGTGLASLSQLVNFPFDKIKIDPALTEIQRDDPKSRAVVRAIAALGRTLGIATMAEGIESSAHLRDVRADGCHALRGFFLQAPLGAAELPHLFTATHVEAPPFILSLGQDQ